MFEDSWAQKAGCASVLASHLYTYYLSLHRLSKKEFFKNHEYLCIRIFNIPGRHGYPFLYKFARTFLSSDAKQHIDLNLYI